MIDAHKHAFKEEASELLSELEYTLLELENTPEDNELISKVFRALHTIKGSAGMFGFDDISKFTHDIESVYDLVRNNLVKITKVIINLTLQARDLIALMLQDNTIIDEEKTREVLLGFKKIVSEHNNSGNELKNPESDSIQVEPEIKQNELFYLIHFQPSPNIYLSGTNPLLLIDELKSLGKTIVLTDVSRIPQLPDLNPDHSYLCWNIILISSCGMDAIKDVFIFIEDQCELNIRIVDEGSTHIDSDNINDLEDYIKIRSSDPGFNIDKCLNNYFDLHTGINNEQTSRKKKKENSRTDNEQLSSLRISSDKLDELLNLVGELVTVQARLSQIAQNNNDTDILSVAEEVERITWSLRDNTLNIRMLPIGTTFSKFKRLVHDLSQELGKEVELTMEGADTELDKTVIEKLNDPLIHIIRNSIDHGIELPELRKKSGKAACGKINLSASQSGGNVIIKITDDGKGLEKDAIRLKAVNMGFINENSELSDNEIYSLIFMPGFSTAKKVTSVSGRGVGMDVVRKAIENLRGTIELSSKPLQGTSITLKLPLTLAIIEGLLVEIENDHYILPLSDVEECVELSQSDIEKAHGRNIVNIRGNTVPYINLREKFAISGQRPFIQQIVIAGINKNRIGFVVDKVIGHHQTVLKTLGKIYKNVDGVSGATILGDGTVALILDIIKLAEKTEHEEKFRYN